MITIALGALVVGFATFVTTGLALADPEGRGGVPAALTFLASMLILLVSAAYLVIRGIVWILS